jgi:uncharacterized membrane protein
VSEVERSSAGAPEPLSVNRSEALSDGIYAVAMTLLVIELKLPDAPALHAAGDVFNGLVALLPKVWAWGLSFFVLSLFWIGHHRVFNHVRYVDATLLLWNLVQLACVSLMPFSSALIGEAGNSLAAQIVYSANMASLAITALVISRHVYRHPELTRSPVSDASFRGARMRVVGVIVVSLVAVLLAATVKGTGVGKYAFALMLVITPLSHAFERRERARASAARAVA